MKLDLKIKTYVSKNFSKKDETSGDKLVNAGAKGMAIGAGVGTLAAPAAIKEVSKEIDKMSPNDYKDIKFVKKYSNKLKETYPSKDVDNAFRKVDKFARKAAKVSLGAGEAAAKIAKTAGKGLVAGLAVGTINAVRSKSKSEAKDK